LGSEIGREAHRPGNGDVLEEGDHERKQEEEEIILPEGTLLPDLPGESQSTALASTLATRMLSPTNTGLVSAFALSLRTIPRPV